MRTTTPWRQPSVMENAKLLQPIPGRVFAPSFRSFLVSGLRGLHFPAAHRGFSLAFLSLIGSTASIAGLRVPIFARSILAFLLMVYLRCSQSLSDECGILRKSSMIQTSKPKRGRGWQGSASKIRATIYSNWIVSGSTSTAFYNGTTKHFPTYYASGLNGCLYRLRPHHVQCRLHWCRR